MGDDPYGDVMRCEGRNCERVKHFMEAKQRGGRITCAGSVSALGPISSVDPERWWNDVTTDLRGTMLCVQAVLGPMLQADAGHIVTVYGNLGRSRR